MMKTPIVLFIFFCLFSTAVYRGLRFLETAPSKNVSDRRIEIVQGATFGEVTDLLVKEGLVTNGFLFRLLGKFTRKERKIKPGEYRLHRAIRPIQLLDILVRGDIVSYRVVIPEGMSSEQIGEILEKTGLVSTERFRQLVHDPSRVASLGFEGPSLEGYLFPDTYRFTKQSTPEQIVTHIAAQFKNVYDDAFKARAKDFVMTQREVVTLASIIEKETAVSDERTAISAVFHNRLKKKMRLQSDPTVIFSLKDFDGNLRREDLLNDSPYNTYRVNGLPPGPIASPGRAALHAALHPADVDYLYFVSKNDGTHHFSLTLEEHNAAVRKYQLKQGSNPVLVR